jgi:hypothetical protein
MQPLRVLAHLFFFGYALMLLCVGLSGIFIAPYELTRIFNVDTTRMTSLDAATLFNQYRFLKALEFGLGVFCLRYWRRIFLELSFNRFFLMFVLAGVAARGLSLVVDGPARWPFVAFLLLELATALVVFAWTRPHLEPT